MLYRQANSFGRMVSTSLSCLLCALVIASVASTSTTSTRIDGFEHESGRDSWYVQVDGVMGGKSSGALDFTASGTTDDEQQSMKFTGTISLDGGGFSSIRRRYAGDLLDLSDYAGVVVTLETQLQSPSASVPPLGVELSFGDATSRYDFSSAFAVPLSTNANISSVYLPMESFDRGTFIGFLCRDGCSLDPSKIDSLSVYVLFQEGDFEVTIHSIEAVREPRAFSTPILDAGTSQDIATLLQNTIASGGGLYDKSYVELCIAIYWSVLNTLVASPEVPESVKVVLCAGLERAAEIQSIDGVNEPAIAWALRYTIDAVLADLNGSERSIVENWLPTKAEADSMEVNCVGRTSMAQGIFYNGEDYDVHVGGNTTVSATGWYSNKDDTEERDTSAGHKWIAPYAAWIFLVAAALHV